MGATCRICDGRLQYRWTLPVLAGKHRAQYDECADCQALQVRAPDWLDEAYADEAFPTGPDADPGRFRRNYSAFTYLCALRDAGVLSPAPRAVDYGGGYGLLARMLVDGGWDAWTFDPHVRRPLFAVERSLHELPEREFDVVLALEVFEHLPEPIRDAKRIRRSLVDGGTVILSTGLYEADQHGPDWEYLAREWGQHVTFWSRKALAHLCAVVEMNSIGYFPGSDGFLVIMSPLAPAELRPRLDAAAQLLEAPDLLARRLRPWDLRSDGIVAGGVSVGEPTPHVTLR